MWRGFLFFIGIVCILPYIKAEASINITYANLWFSISGDSLNNLQGKTSLHFSGTSLETLELDLDSAVICDSIYYHGSKLEIYSHTNNSLLIPIESGIPSDSICIYYRAFPIKYNSNEYSSSHFSYAPTPIMWTMSEPYYAKQWWPGQHNLQDKIDSIDIFIQCDSIFTGVANGVLTETSSQGKLKTYHWKHRYPIAPYLIGIAVAPYNCYDTYYYRNSTDSLLISNYYYKGTEQDIIIAIEEFKQALSLYESILGPYPFSNEQYAHAQFEWAGAMEHQTMTFTSNFSLPLLSHELLHQWFGNKITCGSWKDIWLNEGFASYFTGLIHEYNISDRDHDVWLNYLKELTCSVPDGSVHIQDTTETKSIFDYRLSYNKGPFLLHMLRNICGDEIFFNAISQYINEERLAYSFARTTDFIDILEQESNKDFSIFMNQWYYGEGYPLIDVQLCSYYDSIYFVQINQTVSDSSIQNFQVSIPIQFCSSDSCSEISFNIHEQTFDTLINFKHKITTIIVDPNNAILERNSRQFTYDCIQDQPFEVSLYPNPLVENKITLQNNYTYPLHKISIYNMRGEKILEQNINEAFTQQEYQLPPLECGVYLLVLEYKDRKIVKRFIKR